MTKTEAAVHKAAMDLHEWWKIGFNQHPYDWKRQNMLFDWLNKACDAHAKATGKRRGLE